jgi:putative ABC transport system ATP-binding protein
MTVVETRSLVRLDGVSVRIGPTVALAPVDLHIVGGEVLVVHGRSGMGKSTLLAVLAGWLDRSAGAIEWSEPLDGGDRRRWHRTAFVPQSLALLEELSLAENVALAAVLHGASWSEARAVTAVRLDALGIGDLGERRPAEVSLGQQQRCALARALVLEPSLMLADEPTAHLDAASAALVITELRRAAAAGCAVVAATHDPALRAAADRAIGLVR